MAKKDKKQEIGDLLKRAKQAPDFNAPMQEKSEAGEISPSLSRGKGGRPTDKKKGVEYVRLSCRISKDLRKRLRSCTTELKNSDQVKSQDGVIIEALEAYLSSRGF